MTTDPLLEPFQLGSLTLKNRVFSSSHAPGYNTDGVPNERYIAYHEEKARGGIGMTMIGGSSNVSIDSASLWGQLSFGSDAIIDPLAEMAERIHRHGAAVMSQVTHMGRRNVSNDGDWLPTIAPSPIREPMHRGWPKEMDRHDIRRVVDDFGAAAVRARAGGLDGIEICATSHLIDQFWTPLANRRTDEYGGSIENRLRFTIEVLQSIREATGSDLLVGIRMIADEDQIGGLTREESADIALRLAASGLLDFLNITSSSLATEEGLSKAIPPAGTPLLPFVSLAASIKASVDLPILHATRITDLASARHAISAGHIDLAGMTRAHIADPHLVAKLERGEEHRVRVCVGASLCINRLHQGLESVCIQNPATGRETHIPQLVSRSPSATRAVVVGGGPAGLEAARVLAERGHAVTLFEAQDRVGGQVVLAARASERQSELLGIVGWLEAELAHLGVDIRLRTIADVDTVLADAPSIVIIATGGFPDTSFLDEGAEHVLSTWDVLGGHARIDGGSVLVYDDHGGEPAPSVAEYLSEQAEVDIELVSPDRMIGQDMAATTGPAYLRMLYERQVTLTPDHRLVRVVREGTSLRATLRNEFTRAEDDRVVDHVIVEHGVVPAAELYESLRSTSANDGVTDLARLVAGKPQPVPGEGFALHRIGDAVSSRGIAAGIHDARRLCQSL